MKTALKKASSKEKKSFSKFGIEVAKSYFYEFLNYPNIRGKNFTFTWLKAFATKNALFSISTASPELKSITVNSLHCKFDNLLFAHRREIPVDLL